VAEAEKGNPFDSVLPPRIEPTIDFLNRLLTKSMSRRSSSRFLISVAACLQKPTKRPLSLSFSTHPYRVPTSVMPRVPSQASPQPG
jgi:hypothetical protein